MIILPDTAVTELIHESANDKVVVTLDKGGNTIDARIVIVAAGAHNIELVLDAIANVQARYGLNRQQLQIGTHRFFVSETNPGHATHKLKVESALNAAKFMKRILVFFFDEWSPQSRPQSIIVAAVGPTHTAAIRENLYAKLERETARVNEQLIETAADVPTENFTNKEN